MRRRVAVAVLVGVLAAAAFAGLWRAATAPGPQSLEARTQAVAATLRCPTCQNLAVADSPSAMAGGMRDIIAEQLDAGRTPGQVRAWFVDRYGPWILLYPPREGISWAAWLAPALALLGAGALAWRRLGRGRRMVLDDEHRARAEDAYRRQRAGDLTLGDSPADERLAVALELLAAIRRGDDDLTGAASEEVERIALRQVSAALADRRHEEAAARASTAAEPPAQAPAATRRRAAAWAVTAAIFGVAVTVLLPSAIGPRAVGGAPTGSTPDRSGPAIVSDDETELTAAERAELRQLAQAVEADPYDVATRLTLAERLRAAGRAEAAAIHYRQAVSVRPDDQVLRLTLAVVLLQLGDIGGAERHAAQVLDDQPDHPEALLVVGLARLAQGRPSGEAELRRFLEIAPDEHPGRAMANAALGEGP